MTADPNTPQTIPPGSLGAKLPSQERGEASATALETRPAPPKGSRYVGVELWLHRITVLMFGLVCAVVGVLLVIKIAAGERHRNSATWKDRKRMMSSMPILETPQAIMAMAQRIYPNKTNLPSSNYIRN